MREATRFLTMLDFVAANAVRLSDYCARERDRHPTDRELARKAASFAVAAKHLTTAADTLRANLGEEDAERKKDE